MNDEERKLAMKIINKMMAVAYDTFEEEKLEHFIKFKITARELRLGDYSLGEEIVVDDIKEFANCVEVKE